VGAKVVKYLAADLKTAYPGQRGFSERNLKYMLKMARTWPDGIVQQPAAQLPYHLDFTGPRKNHSEPERDEPTIGLLIAKSKNGEVVDYALHASKQSRRPSRRTPRSSPR
jgi:hypothetical protein